jgi:hypothetical protein
MPPSTRFRSSSRERNPMAGTTTDDEREDAVVRQRVPRDVRAVSRRLDRHQAQSSAAFDTLHGELAKLTSMMASMQSSLTNIHPPAEPPPSQQNPTFRTPPPLPNKPLSPILEETTPIPKHSTAKTPPFPPNLGNLTPDQLPIPPSGHHTQPVRQIANVTTTEPITSATPSSSQQTINHVTQCTNPASNPSIYTNIPNFPSYPPPPNFPSYYPPNSPIPYPYYPFFPQLPQPNQYPPPYPSPYNAPPQPQFQHHITMPQPLNIPPQPQEPHLRTPHVELPTFLGENPRAWIIECEDIFTLVGIPAEHKVKWGLAHIRGQAKTWLNSAGLSLQSIS